MALRRNRQQPQGQQGRMPQGRGGMPQRPNMPQEPRMTAPEPAQKTKVKKPVTKGTVIAYAFIVSFILIFVFAVALAVFSIGRSASDQAEFDQMLSDAKNEVRQASIDVAFSPAEEYRQNALQPSVNIEVMRGEQKAQDNNQSQDGQSNQTQGNQQTAENNNGNAGAQQGDNQQGQSQDNQADIRQNADDSETTSFGSGVVIFQKGDLFYILTNNHVIKDATKIIATIGDEEFEADVTGTDQSTDLAVIAVKAKDLKIAERGSSANVRVGDFTMSVGNPYGLNDSMTTGVISALGRNMVYVDGSNSIMYANMMQTDTPVSPGNSGGGLYDATGRLIGINTLITGDAGHPDAIGYAIPIDFAMPIANNLIAGNPAAHSSFGLALSNVPDDQIKKYGLTSDAGAYVNSVTPSGPAEIAGIVPNDIIVSYDGEEVKNAQDMLYKIRASVINDTKEIIIKREGKEMKLSIKVGSDV